MIYKEALNALLKVVRAQVNDIQEKMNGLADDLPHVPNVKINPDDLYAIMEAMDTASERMNYIMHDLGASE